MSYFDVTIPADSEGVKLGAGRIRAMKTALDTIIAKIFDDSGNFLNKWVLGAMIANDPTTDASRAIGSDHLKNGAALTRVLPDGVLSADATGRAKVADGFFAADAPSRAKFADGIWPLAKLAWSSFFSDAPSKSTPTGTDLILIGDAAAGNACKAISLIQARQVGTSVTAEQNIVTGATITVAHGLLSTPNRVRWVLVCKIADLGYSVGEEVSVSGARDNNNGLDQVTESADSSFVYLNIGTHAWALMSKSSFGFGAINTSNWKLKCYAGV